MPAFSIVSTGFMRQAEATRKAMGIPHVWIAEYPGVIPNDSDEIFERKIREDVFPSLLEGFAAPVDDVVDVEVEPVPGSVAFHGTFDQVQDHVVEQLWGDGLPVVPPTPQRVEKFLAFTDRDPDEVLGILHPELREATIRTVAINGVMAGCRPEYLPILVAVAEAIADPHFRLEDAGSTPGWEPLVIVSGPLVGQLDFNTEGGLMRVGRRANATVGRFLRLFMRNVAGFRVPPGGTDKGSIGYSFNVALAENEAAVRELGWTTFGQDRGFDPEDTVVTVQSVVGISPPIYSGGSTALEHLEYITYYATHTPGPWAYTNIKYGQATPLLVMSPSVASGIADDGWSKDDIRQHLFENVRLPARLLERYGRHVEGAEFTFADYVARKVADPLYAESDDPDRLLPLLLAPGHTGIVLAGDPGRNQCRWYANNHEQGPATSRLVRLLPDYSDRLDATGNGDG